MAIQQIPTFRDLMLDLATTEIEFSKPPKDRYLESLVREMQTEMAKLPDGRNTSANRLRVTNMVVEILQREKMYHRIGEFAVNCTESNNEPTFTQKGLEWPNITVAIDFGYIMTRDINTVAIHLTKDTAKCFTTIKDAEMGLTEVKSEVF